MNNQELLQEIQKTNRMLNALLAIVTDRHLRDTDLAKPRPRSIDRMLSDNGMSNAEIAKLLGKSPQAVGQSLNSEKKPVKSNSATSDTEAEGVN